MSKIRHDVEVDVGLFVSVSCHNCGNPLHIESTGANGVVLHIVVGNCKHCRVRIEALPEGKENDKP